MKLCMSHYNHKSIHDAKFEDASFQFWRYDVTKFPSEEGNESSNSAMYPQKTGLRSSRPKIDPPCQFQQFTSRGKFLGRLSEKRAAESHQVWAS